MWCYFTRFYAVMYCAFIRMLYFIRKWRNKTDQSINQLLQRISVLIFQVLALYACGTVLVMWCSHTLGSHSADWKVRCNIWFAILIAHQLLWQNMKVPVSIFQESPLAGKTSRETVSHPQCPLLPTLCKISLPIYVIVTNKLLQPLTTTWYDSLVLSFSLLKI